jgi:spore coat protein U-like protein
MFAPWGAFLGNPAEGGALSVEFHRGGLMYLMCRIIKTSLLMLLFTFLGIFEAEIALSQCTMNATPINFGNYDAFSSTPLDATGTITVNCAAIVNKVNVKLGVSSSSGSFNPRRMKRSGGSDLLDYNIYTDVTRTVIFGDGTGGTSDIGIKRAGTPAPWSENIGMYGRISPGQEVSAGTYSDTLTATVNP